MRVLLIIPTHRYSWEFPSAVGITDLPIGMAYVSAHLKAQGNEVMACNLNNLWGWSDKRVMVRETIDSFVWKFRPDSIMTGGLCTDYECLKHITQCCRTYAPSAGLVIGGGIATHDPEFVRDNLRPDVVFEGEFDWKEGQEIDSLPFPDYSIFGDFMAHASANRWLYRFPQPNPRPMVLVAARSCPFRCSFCVHEKRVPYRARSIPNIIAELEVMHDRYHFNILVILDELFAVTRNRVEEFSQAILDSRLRFSWCFQTHASAQLDSDTLRLAKAAGCYFFSYGIESAAPTVLASMNKRATPTMIQEGIEKARETGILFGGNFIFGDPSETWETVFQSLLFYWRHCRDCFITFCGVRPYPGSRLFDYCQERGIIKDKLRYYQTIDRRYYNMTHMPSCLWLPFLKLLGGLSRLEVACIQRRLRHAT